MQNITIKGRVTIDPELKESEGGKKYISLGVACNQPGTDKDGNSEELTTFYSIYLFDKMAEIFVGLRKGDMIFAIGKLKQRSYSSKEGYPKTENKVFADEFHKVAFVDDKSEGDAGEDRNEEK